MLAFLEKNWWSITIREILFIDKDISFSSHIVPNFIFLSMVNPRMKPGTIIQRV